MKTPMHRWLSVLVLAVGLSGAMAPAIADDDTDYSWGPMGHGWGSGMMGGGRGYGMMGYGRGGWGMMGEGAGHLAFLNLSAEQRDKVNKIHDDLRHQHWATMGQIMDERAKLRDLYEADKRDAQAILKAEDAMYALRRKMSEAHLDAENRIDAVLTKEQREKLQEVRRGGWPGMMGPGMHGWGGPARGMTR